MADAKVTALAAITSVADTDLLYAVSDPGGTPVSKKVTKDNLLRRAYGGLYVQGGSTAESTTDATPRKIAAFTTAMPASSRATVAAATDNITLTDAGDYEVAAQISFSGTLSKTFRVEVYKDAVATGISFLRKLGTGGDVGSASLVGIVTITAGQALSLYHSSTDGGTAFTVVDGQFSVRKLV